MSNNLSDYIKRRALRKIIKRVLFFVLPNIVPITLIILAFILVVNGASIVFSYFSNFINENGSSSNYTQDIRSWANSLSDEEVEEMMLYGSTINPKQIPKYIDLEEQSIPSDLNVKSTTKVVTTQNGNSNELITQSDYKLKLYSASFPYRLDWKIIASIDSIYIGTKLMQTEDDAFMKDVASTLQPQYTWLYNEHSKDMTKVVQYWKKVNKDGNVTTTLVKEVATTDYYPLEHLQSVNGVFADYQFSYKENVKTFESDWEKRNVKTTKKTTGGNPIRNEAGEIVGRTKKHTTITTTWTMEKDIVVEDVLEEVSKIPRLDKVVSVLNKYNLSTQDLGIMREVLKAMPDTADICEDFMDVINLTEAGYLDIETGEYNEIGINPNVPVIEGVWKRIDLAQTAYSLLDIPYFWGGKYARKGACPYWGDLKKVTADGNWATGKMIPYGLDCSGYVDWVYYQMIGQTIGKGGGTTSQYVNTYQVTENELKIGDLGFYGKPPNCKHVGIYIGQKDGKKLFIHAGGRTWKDSDHIAGRVVISYNNTSEYYKGNAPTKFIYYRRPYVTFADD